MKSLKMSKTDVTRRDFMRVSAFATAGTILVCHLVLGRPGKPYVASIASDQWSVTSH
jgi:hypothetical protein